MLLSQQRVHRVTVQYYDIVGAIDSFKFPDKVRMLELDTIGMITYSKVKQLEGEFENLYTYEYDEDGRVVERIHDRQANIVRGNLRESGSFEAERRSYIYEDGRLLEVVTDSDSREFSSQITYKYTRNGTIEAIDVEYHNQIEKFALNGYQRIDSISRVERDSMGIFTENYIPILYYAYNSRNNIACACNSHVKTNRLVYELVPRSYQDIEYIYDTNQRVTDIVVRSSVATPGEYHCLCNPTHEHDNSQILFSFQIKYNDRGLPISSFSKDGGRGVLLYRYEYYDE